MMASFGSSSLGWVIGGLASFLGGAKGWWKGGYRGLGHGWWRFGVWEISSLVQSGGRLYIAGMVS